MRMLGDTYISAFQFRGTPERLLMLAAEGKIDLAISDEITEEVTRTLHEKFDWPDDRIKQAQRLMHRIARRVVPCSDARCHQGRPVR